MIVMWSGGRLIYRPRINLRVAGTAIRRAKCEAAELIVLAAAYIR